MCCTMKNAHNVKNQHDKPLWNFVDTTIGWADYWDPTLVEIREGEEWTKPQSSDS